jgi:hypothetical protein
VSNSNHTHSHSFILAITLIHTRNHTHSHSQSHSFILAITLIHTRNRTQSYSQSHSIALGPHYRHLAEEFIATLFGAHAHLMRGAIRELQRRSSPFGRGPLDEGRNQRGPLDEGRNQRDPRVVSSSLAISMHAAAPTRRRYQHAMSMQSACTPQHPPAAVISMQSECNQNAISMHS